MNVLLHTLIGSFSVLLVWNLSCMDWDAPTSGTSNRNPLSVLTMVTLCHTTRPDSQTPVHFASLDPEQKQPDSAGSTNSPCPMEGTQTAHEVRRSGQKRGNLGPLPRNKLTIKTIAEK